MLGCATLAKGAPSASACLAGHDTSVEDRLASEPLADWRLIGPMSAPGQTRTSSLGAPCPLPPSADIGPGGQSVGQAAQFCLGPAPPPGRRAEGRLRRPRSSEDSEMFTRAACLLLRREVLDALAKPTEPLGRLLVRLAGALTLEPIERPDILQVRRRRWRIDVLWWRWRIDRLIVHGRARLDYRRLSPAGEEFVVDDAWYQERRETACEAEEKIQVGMVPTHVQLQRDFAPLASLGHTCRAPSYVQRVLGGEPQSFARLACDTH